MASVQGITARQGILIFIKEQKTFANTDGAAQRVAPVGGKRPRLGTNPLCIGVPGGKDGPFILDFGTSATAEGKVRVKRIAGDEVPPGWILDPDGHPTTDPNQLYGEPPGTILPMGGDRVRDLYARNLLYGLLPDGYVRVSPEDVLKHFHLQWKRLDLDRLELEKPAQPKKKGRK